MRTSNQIIYLTFDGILDPLGYSQVVRPVLGLARRGYRYTICSLERRDSLDRTHDVGALRATLAANGVGWRAASYESGAVGITANLSRMAWMAKSTMGPETRMIHARSYLGGAIALALQQSFGIPYVFDIRGYWVDERREEGRWFTTNLRLRGARMVERAMYRRASACVALTQLAADDVRGGRFGPWGEGPSICIPTLADFDEFNLSYRAAERPPLLSGKTVLAHVGGLNVFYRLDAMAEVARRALAVREDIVFLGLTHTPDALGAILRGAGVPVDRVVLESARHVDMPRWLGCIDWGFLLLGTQESKRAAMPTKLGEFLAAGVRPVHHGCNSEVRDWVDRAGTGTSVSSLSSPGDIDELVRAVVKRRPLGDLLRGREVARAHFALEHGVDRYCDLLASLGVTPVDSVM